MTTKREKAGRPPVGPYRHTATFRFGDCCWRLLLEIPKRTGENRTELLRRLLREEAARLGLAAREGIE